MSVKIIETNARQYLSGVIERFEEFYARILALPECYLSSDLQMQKKGLEAILPELKNLVSSDSFWNEHLEKPVKFYDHPNTLKSIFGTIENLVGKRVSQGK